MRHYIVSAALLAASAGIVSLSLGNGGGSEAAVPEVSPRSNYLGFGHHPDQEDALYAKEEAQRQGIIASCMADHRFQYWPRPLDQAASDPYVPDPNTAYRDTLSPTELRDYLFALTGRSGAEGMTADEMERFDANSDGRIDFDERSGLGCLGRAEQAVPGVFHVVGVLRDQLRGMEADVMADPRTVSAHAAYVECMNSLGIKGSALDDVRSSLIDMAFADDSTRLPDNSVCESDLDAAMAAVRLTAEEEFFAANRETIEKYAVPAG